MSALPYFPRTEVKRKPVQPNRFKQAAFLAAYGKTGSLKEAASAAKIAHSTHWRWMDLDPTYPERFKQAQRRAVFTFEDEAVRRAVRGITKGIYYKGERVDEEIVYSDFLLHKVLQAVNPDKWKERVETTQVWDGDFSKLTEAQLEVVVKQLDQMAAAQLAVKEKAQAVDVTPEPEVKQLESGLVDQQPAEHEPDEGA